MTDTTRVPGPTSPLQGNSGKAITVVLVAILIAVIKPWGLDPGTTPALATLFPSTAPSSAPIPASRDVFDFGVFEGFEPAPGWEIWPAGREVTFGFAMKVGADGEPAAAGIGPPASPPSAAPDGSAAAGGSPPVDGTTSPSPRPSATLSPSPSPSPSPTPDTGPPMWSNSITINPANTLTVVAINMPLGYSIPDVRLTRLEAGRGRVEVPILRLPSPWPDHFLVIGLDDGTGDNARDAWPPGDYALDLGIEPGGWTRSIGIEVAARPDQR